MSEIEEHDIWLSQIDMDHLRDGAPVYKGIDDETRLVLRVNDDTE